MKYETLEEELASVKSWGEAIKYIDNPCLEVQLGAVRQDAYAIIEIKNPPVEVQLEAVRQNDYVIQFIKNPPLEVQLIAIKKLGVTSFFSNYVGKFKDITYDVIIKDKELINTQIIGNLLIIDRCVYTEDELVALQVLRDSLA